MKKICAVRDRAIDAFGQPIFCHTVSEAIRAFADQVNNRQSPMNSHPEDYDLYLIGTYADEDGSLVGEKPQMIAAGKEVFKESASL